jgi:Zn-finger nucleic acid-binding protein
MPGCNSCSAPLPANTNRCTYCGTRNDVDLHAWQNHAVQQSPSERLCPECNKTLQTIDLKIKGGFYIEHCPECFGLFFDPGEIEQLLDHSVSNVFQVNYKHLLNINRDRFQQRKIKYIRCPVCQVLMNRVNFGRKSGVVIDQCINHGVWLDSGELIHLMEWKKAGGQILHRRNIKTNNRRYEAPKSNHTSPSIFSHHELNNSDLIENIASVLAKLFG